MSYEHPHQYKVNDAVANEGRSDCKYMSIRDSVKRWHG